MRFRILGPLEVYSGDGTPVSLRAPKPRALLAVLLLQANEPVSTGRIESVLWPAGAPRSATGVVRTYASDLRRLLGLGERGPLPCLAKEPAGYRLRLEPTDLDLTMFDDLSARGRHALKRGDAALASRILSEALTLWRGEPAADIVLDGDGTAAVAALGERRLTAEEAWAEARLALGGDADLIGRLRRIAAREPLRERVHGQLMRALYAGGRKAEALEEFRALRRRLKEELGIEPSAPVQDLHRLILADHSALVPARASVIPRQLPRDTGDFTGRDAQLAAMEAALPMPGITLVAGTAGAGKTALAVHFAHRVADRFPDGQLFADLRGHTGAEPVPAAEVLRRFLRALGATDVPAEADEAAAAYRSLLAGKRVLVMLDNAATSSQVRPLLPGSPGCLVLVTSRSRLTGLVARDGGVPVSVGPLPRSESVALLRKILGAHRVDAEPLPATMLAAHCADLPLALRVAAERAVHRPCKTLAAMAAELADERRRLDILTAEDEGSTVRSVLSWSYHGLGPDAARVFRLLGLHPGTDISVPAAAALAGETLTEADRALDQLADAHLAEEVAADRYRSHDLLRAYAAERAAREDSPAHRAAAIRRVLTFYLHTADAANRLIGGARRRVSLAPAHGATPLSFAGYDEAVAWCETEQQTLVGATRLAAREGLDDMAWQLPATMADFFALRRPWDNWIACGEIALAAARRAGDIRGQACSLTDLGNAYHSLMRFKDAAACYEEALRLVRQAGDRHDEGTMLNNLAAMHWELSRTDDALDCFRQSLALARETGNRHGEGIALDNLGEAYRRTGEPRRAIGFHREALAIARQVGDKQGESQALRNLGAACHALGLTRRSREWYLRALDVCRHARDRQGEAETQWKLGDLRASAGQVASARDHWRRALAILTELGDPRAAEVRALLG